MSAVKNRKGVMPFPAGNNHQPHKDPSARWAIGMTEIADDGNYLSVIWSAEKNLRPAKAGLRSLLHKLHATWRMKDVWWVRRLPAENYYQTHKDPSARWAIGDAGKFVWGVFVKLK